MIPLLLLSLALAQDPGPPTDPPPEEDLAGALADGEPISLPDAEEPSMDWPWGKRMDLWEFLSIVFAASMGLSAGVTGLGAVARSRIGMPASTLKDPRFTELLQQQQERDDRVARVEAGLAHLREDLTRDTDANTATAAQTNRVLSQLSKLLEQASGGAQ